MRLPIGEPGESPVEAAKQYIRRGQRRLAIELLEPWVEDYPADADAWSVLAAAQFELDNFSGAVQAARRAVELKPSARNWCNLGMVLRKLGQLYEAERAQYKALVVDSGYERARTELRKIHEIRTGRRARHRQRFDDM
ncbi:MAG: hypothetical protein ACP5KN_14645 [Armatimonadota bacterium]